MHSYLLSAQDFARLSEAPDFPNLVSQLKQTAYGPYLSNLKEDELTPRRVAIQIKGRLAEVYNSVIHMAPGHIRPLLLQLYRYFEVDNLKAVLRAIVSGADWEQVRDVIFPMGSMSVVPAEAMIEAGSVAAAVCPGAS